MVFVPTPSVEATSAGAVILAIGYAMPTFYLLYSLVKGTPAPANPWPGRVERYPTLHDACVAAVAAEIANAALYERLLASTTRPDILAVFGNLQEASQQRHLRAFQRCVERRG